MSSIAIVSWETSRVGLFFGHTFSCMCLSDQTYDEVNAELQNILGQIQLK